LPSVPFPASPKTTSTYFLQRGRATGKPNDAIPRSAPGHSCGGAAERLSFSAGERLTSARKSWRQPKALMNPVTIRKANFDRIVAQAEREFPFECCGFILGIDAIGGADDVEEVRPITNIQNLKHAEDPIAFARDARTAFLMEPREHLAVMNEIDRRHLNLTAVYHSHPDHDAYFSATDRAQACSFDPSEPDYPDTVYIVISVRAGKFARAAAFRWDPASKDFAEAELETT
jgi:proteasome lid subunit RPN8/RPN11